MDQPRLSQARFGNDRYDLTATEFRAPERGGELRKLSGASNKPVQPVDRGSNFPGRPRCGGKELEGFDRLGNAPDGNRPASGEIDASATQPRSPAGEQHSAWRGLLLHAPRQMRSNSGSIVVRGVAAGGKYHNVAAVEIGRAHV